MPAKVTGAQFEVLFPAGGPYGGARLIGVIDEKGMKCAFSEGFIAPNGEKNFVLLRKESYWE